MKNIVEIYDEYQIMMNLRDHMFRVAAVASLISDNFDKPLNKSGIISACLFHDMGNIIKFNLGHFPESLEPEGLDYWNKIKNKYIEKYGRDEHLATIMISKENQLSTTTIDIIKHIGFSKTTENEFEKSFECKICNYADMRVGPYGVLSLEERMFEAHERYKNREHSLSSGDFDSLSQSLQHIEKQIFTKCKIKPEDINNITIEPIVSELKHFVLK